GDGRLTEPEPHGSGCHTGGVAPALLCRSRRRDEGRRYEADVVNDEVVVHAAAAEAPAREGRSAVPTWTAGLARVRMATDPGRSQVGAWQVGHQKTGRS